MTSGWINANIASVKFLIYIWKIPKQITWNYLPLILFFIALASSHEKDNPIRARDPYHRMSPFLKTNMTVWLLCCVLWFSGAISDDIWSQKETFSVSCQKAINYTPLMLDRCIDLKFLQIPQKPIVITEWFLKLKGILTRFVTYKRSNDHVGY